MIGNDIVDLQLAKFQSNWMRKGFLEKQFTNQEQDCILNSDNSFQTVWRIWTMKEAVYKVVAQREKKRFFAPKKFECNLISTSLGEVKYGQQGFFTQTNLSKEYIHSHVGEPSFQWIGRKVEKKEMMSIIGKQLELDSNHLQIKKDKLNIPNLFYNGIRLSTSFSITGHGKFTAFEYILK